jgi:hypothetical protein
MNNEMISFPRELSDDLAELIAEKARVCGGGAYDIWEAICKAFGQPVAPHQTPNLHEEFSEWSAQIWMTEKPPAYAWDAFKKGAAVGAKQSQGEPVAYADPMAFTNFKAGKTDHEWMWANKDFGLIPLYSMQPADKDR